MLSASSARPAVRATGDRHRPRLDPLRVAPRERARWRRRPRSSRGRPRPPAARRAGERRGPRHRQIRAPTVALGRRARRFGRGHVRLARAPRRGRAGSGTRSAAGEQRTARCLEQVRCGGRPPVLQPRRCRARRGRGTRHGDPQGSRSRAASAGATADRSPRRRGERASAAASVHLADPPHRSGRRAAPPAPPPTRHRRGRRRRNASGLPFPPIPGPRPAGRRRARRDRLGAAAASPRSAGASPRYP